VSFIELLLDFIEAMNVGVIFTRHYTILKDRDITGELKEVWNAVLAIRDSEQRPPQQETCSNSSNSSSSKSMQYNHRNIIRILRMVELLAAKICTMIIMVISLRTQYFLRMNLRSSYQDRCHNSITAMCLESPLIVTTIVNVAEIAVAEMAMLCRIS